MLKTLNLLTFPKQFGLTPFSNKLFTLDSLFSLTAVNKCSSYIIIISLILDILCQYI